MKQFDKGWWNCFNSFANNTLRDNDSVCIEAGITKDEIEEELRNGDLYGNAANIVNEYYKNNYIRFN